MGNVEFFRVQPVVSMVWMDDSPKEAGVIVDLGKVLDHLVPRRTAHILQDDDGWLILLDPLQHPSKCPAGFTVRFDVLLLVVEVGIVDTGCTSDQDLPLAEPCEHSRPHCPVLPPRTHTPCAPSSCPAR